MLYILGATAFALVVTWLWCATHPWNDGREPAQEAETRLLGNASAVSQHRSHT